MFVSSYSVCRLYRTNTEVVADEGGMAVFLTVSRSNGLESSVSVEWEMQSDTATATRETHRCLNPKTKAPLFVCCSFNPHFLSVTMQM